VDWLSYTLEGGPIDLLRFQGVVHVSPCHEKPGVSYDADEIRSWGTRGGCDSVTSRRRAVAQRRRRISMAAYTLKDDGAQ
jgi:hypothetical protein